MKFRFGLSSVPAKRTGLWFFLGTMLLTNVGCATHAPIVETANLRDVVGKRTIVLPHPVSRALDNNMKQGLAAGAYVAEKENEFGIFFVGAGRSFFETSRNGRTFYHEGGFWMSKNDKIAPRFYFKLWTSGESVDNATTQTIAGSPLIQTMNPVQAGVGGAIAGGIMAGIAAAHKGEIILLPEVRDTQYVQELQAAAQRQQ